MGGADDIDSLKNRKIRTSGELIQMQIAIGLVRLEKTIRDKMKTILWKPEGSAMCF
jgi:DNA-directed RNA polymerase subunit beta